jgi:hypothetical protein
MSGIYATVYHAELMGHRLDKRGGGNSCGGAAAGLEGETITNNRCHVLTETVLQTTREHFDGGYVESVSPAVARCLPCAIARHQTGILLRER